MQPRVFEQFISLPFFDRQSFCVTAEKIIEPGIGRDEGAFKLGDDVLDIGDLYAVYIDRPERGVVYFVIAQTLENRRPVRSHLRRVLDWPGNLFFERACASIPELRYVEAAVQDRRGVHDSDAAVDAAGSGETIVAAFREVMTGRT